ncbi:hypothetical protein TI39_contig352g00066 [Zymoseptoria brevis]|uniref:DUF7732 domain-containing protein n=1 Tax=Zymoseptoria brevis TaxID=1047168 RepID=A0A0F4GR71_9PEZI|nr:hypothetical protein TI39_contig352g00066 [Zymoseptoria brevis]
MKLPQTLLFLLTLLTTIHALALPALLTSNPSAATELFKRKGGGGGGGRGGGGSSSGGRSGGSSSSSSGGKSGSGSGSSGASTRTAPTSNIGGSTRAGSGTPRAFGAGRGYYGGGAQVPYQAGSRSPTRSVAPFLIGGAALGAVAIFPALALYGAYAYNFGGPYRYYNQTSRTNESLPMDCYCGRLSTCGCDANNNTDWLNDIANNGSVAQKLRINGTDTLVVDGSLPNGTTAPGGSDGAAGSLSQQLAESSGLWVVVAGVVYTVCAM